MLLSKREEAGRAEDHGSKRQQELEEGKHLEDRVVVVVVVVKG